jgi:hypothetical protein
MRREASERDGRARCGEGEDTRPGLPVEAVA